MRADSQRARFMLDHLAWLHRAIEEGADVRGYLHWSMLDNFEWAAGFGPAVRAREVDYATVRAHAAGRRSDSTARIAQRRTVSPRVRVRICTYADGTPSLAPGVVDRHGRRREAAVRGA